MTSAGVVGTGVMRLTGRSRVVMGCGSDVALAAWRWLCGAHGMSMMILDSNNGGGEIYGTHHITLGIWPL